MRLVDNVMRGDFLQDVYQNIGFVYKIDEVIHIQLLEGPDIGQSTHDLIAPVQLTENFLMKNLLFVKETDIYREYFYQDKGPNGFRIYVRVYEDKTISVEAADRTDICAKNIQFIHELQHIFKMFNVKMDWVL